MAVTVLTGNSDDRQRFATGRFSLPLPDKQQITVLHRGNRTVLRASFIKKLASLSLV